MLLWLPQVLRAEGLTVVEVAGWATRGKTTQLAPKVVIAHHTATRASTSDTAVIALLVKGRPDLPGPLCHVGLSRDGTVHLIAAGKANHAGAGTWKGVTGSVNTFGIEAYNDGLGGEPWPQVQLDAYDRICSAVLRHESRDASWLCAHREWATPAGRKPDPVGIDMGQMRSRVQALLDGGDDNMALRKGSTGNAVGALQKAINAWRVGSPPLAVDKVYGDATVAAVSEYQQAANLPVTGVADSVTLALLLTTPLRP
jgi:N-acetyl-anhydromuramyl-L-alanine amidase AmpD